MVWRGIVNTEWLNGLSSGPEYLLVAGRAGISCGAEVGDSRVMTGSRRRDPRDAWPGWRWVGVALSFAGARRPYVEQGASALKARRALLLRRR